MKRLYWIGGAAFAAIYLAPATAQDAAPNKPEGDKKTCRAKEIPTGSIMRSRRICLTKREWATFDDINRRHTDTALNARRINNPPTE